MIFSTEMMTKKKKKWNNIINLRQLGKVVLLCGFLQSFHLVCSYWKRPSRAKEGVKLRFQIIVTRASRFMEAWVTLDLTSQVAGEIESVCYDQSLAIPGLCLSVYGIRYMDLTPFIIIVCSLPSVSDLASTCSSAFGASQGFEAIRLKAV